MTRVADRTSPTTSGSRRATQFDDDELAQVVFAITVINAWNRLCVTTRVEPGHYVPGMFA